MSDAAYEVGERYEATLDDDARDLGAHFTPRDVAEMLVERSLATWSGSGSPVVCDPSCGGGVFLVAAAEALRRRGIAPRRVVDELLVGIDIDPGAVAASAESLRRWAESNAERRVHPRVVVGDALAGAGPGARSVDIVIGNPPFQSQLGSVTARSGAERVALGARFGTAAAGYVDIAALFQLAGLELVRDGGIVTLIQPRSFLVARDVAPVRDAVLAGGVLREVWLAGEQVFAAKVDVCATVVERGAAGVGPVRVTGGRDGAIDHGVVEPGELSASPTWSPVWATAMGVPPLRGRVSATTVGHVASATAGFRDQYYGFLPHLRTDEPSAGARIVTTAMIDPARCTWSSRKATIARRPWVAPWLDREALRTADQRLSAWTDRLLVPKVLVATQTKVIEAVVDPIGDLVPFTPVIAVVPTGVVSAQHLEAALLSPAATAWALRRFGGGGMSSSALKLAARQVAAIPLPRHREPWDEAVALLGSRPSPDDWPAIGRLLDRAWGIDDEAVLEWWLARLRSSIH